MNPPGEPAGQEPSLYVEICYIGLGLTFLILVFCHTAKQTKHHQ